MTTNFPSGYDVYVNPTASPPGTDKLNTPTVLHSSQHTNLNDAVTAIEHAFGLSGTSSGVNYSLNQLSGNVTTINSTVSGLGTTVSGISSGAPVSGTYLTLSTLSGAAARVFTPGAALSGTDAGSGSTYSLRVYPTGVTSGTYNVAAVTVNAQGQLTFVASGTTGVTSGSYGVPTVTVNGYGQITAATSGTTGVTSGNYSTADITVNAYGQVTTAANGVAGADRGFCLPLYPSDAGIGTFWYDAKWETAAFATQTLATGTVVGGSFIAGRTCTLKAIGANFTVGATTGKAYIAIYEETSTLNPFPSALIYGSALINVTGALAYNENVTGTATITKGRRYWGVMTTNAAAITSTAINTVNNTIYFGRPAVSGAATTAPSVLSGTMAFQAFPNPFSGTANIVASTTNMPVVSIQVNTT